MAQHCHHNCIEELKSDHQIILTHLDDLEKTIAKSTINRAKIKEFLHFSETFVEPHHQNMKKIIFSTIGIISLTLLIGGPVLAQGNHTAREEGEGKIVWEKLQAKQTTCADLSEENFGTLGEYFMGQMLGASHEAMNTMMTQMMGKEGEKQMHVVMGKRMSGCEPNAPLPQNMMGGGMMSMMMNMMMGGGASNNSVMNFGFTPFGGLGWIFMILWWGLGIVGIIALIRWLTSQFRGTHGLAKSPLEILRARYAKGEINKKEFEEKKKDLS